METELGLSDFISLMSQPSWVWSDLYDFPRMNSWNELAREEIQKLFNYDLTLEYSDDLKLRRPNFEEISLHSICQNNANFTNYCKLVKKLPDLQTTMHFMNLAMSPTTFDDTNMKKKMRYR